MDLSSYSIAGDVAVVALCVVMVILLTTSYVSRTRSFRIFMFIVFVLVCAALVNISYNFLLASANPETLSAIYVLRVVYHAMLFNVFFLFALYITVVSGLEHHKARIVAVFCTVLEVGIVIADIIITATGHGFQLNADGTISQRSNLFLIGYFIFVILLLVLLQRVQHRLYRRVVYGFYGVVAVSLFIRIGQIIVKGNTLTTLTFVFPVIAMMYIMHSNPYNVTLGAVDIRALEDMVRDMYSRKEEFIFISLVLPDFDEEGKELPEAISAVVRKFSFFYFRRCVLFQIGNGHMILMAPKRRNPDYEERIGKILIDFQKQYDHFKYPYKVVVGESIEEISRKNEYVSLIRSVQQSLPENTVCRISPDDIARFNREEYILNELTDIYNKRDVEDPRVLAFCQPVFNLKTEKFDTAEALMRLDLKETGLVFPDQFIPLAESHGYIHVLTEIILNKTCKEIRRMTEEGYRISRISVNVSVLELKDDDFCSDISRIIVNNNVSGDQVAIELTESRNESDFMIMKRKIEELHHKGIQFYLDDFGTGYSNMERIMELPFDIIKFDRSLVIASGTDKRSEKIVENLAHMFREMDYSVLYEGVEDDADEERCLEMSASYLQGYKYSRPVPLEKLREFLSDAG